LNGGTVRLVNAVDAGFPLLADMNETFDAMASDEITNEKVATVRKRRYLSEECL
jgi:hypothetical protein